jgi:RimJ/RimL family protein N-acetyltransferase
MLQLRPYEASDAEKIVGWLKDEVSFRQWCADRYEKYPITAEDMNEYYERYVREDNLYALTAVDEDGVAGHLTMRFLDREKKAVHFGFIIVDSSKRGKGYGKQMLKLAVQYAHEALEAGKITLGVFENNASAYHCYKSVGFQEAEPEKTERYHILGEDWKCIWLEFKL